MPVDIPLTICGQPYDPRYYDYLRSLAAGKNVRFLVNQNDVALRDLYRRATAVVLPSVFVDCYGFAHAWPELMGYSLLERYGRPLAVAVVGIAFGLAHGLVDALPLLVTLGAGLA